MTFYFRTSGLSRRAGLLAVVVISMAAPGCSPYSTVAKIGVKLIGDAVSDQDVSQKSQQLMGQPISAADATFGERIHTLEEIPTRRLLVTYPVKDDLLHMFRWAVEAENDRIVALSKLQNDPDGGKDIAEKLVLKEIVVGKTPQQVQSHKWFKNLVLTLRDLSNGDILRVYDVSIIPDFMGAKYCILRFDGSNTCQEVRIVGVSASTPDSSLD